MNLNVYRTSRVLLSSSRHCVCRLLLLMPLFDLTFCRLEAATDVHNFPSLFSSFVLCAPCVLDTASLDKIWVFHSVEALKHCRQPLSHIDKVRPFPFSWTLNWLNFSGECVTVWVSLGAAILHMPILLFDLFSASFVLFVGYISTLPARHTRLHWFQLRRRNFHLHIQHTTHYLHISNQHMLRATMPHVAQWKTKKARTRHMLTLNCRYQKNWRK